jgi:hypothetical protein
MPLAVQQHFKRSMSHPTRIRSDGIEGVSGGGDAVPGAMVKLPILLKINLAGAAVKQDRQRHGAQDFPEKW